MAFRLKSILMGLAVFAVSAPVHATETTETVRALLGQTFHSDQQSTPQARDRLAKAVRDYCLEVASVYPTNSPKENEWLLGEIRGGGDRVMRALGSAEMGRRMTSNFTEACSSWSAGFAQAPDDPRIFTGLAYIFVKFMADAEIYARKNGVDPEKYGFGIVPRAAAEALLLAALNAKSPSQ